MKTLVGKDIQLRAIEPEDLDFLFQIENDEHFWEVSHTQTPFSKFALKLYLENAQLDIFETKQLRLIIEEKSKQTAVGLIDLFDFSPQHRRAGIGIVVAQHYQQHGYANQALELLIQYSFIHLQLHQLYASMTADNSRSKQLFEKNNFVKVGVKKDWIQVKNGFKDEIFYQLIQE